MRSFADGNGDGVGDLAGVRNHLPYLRDLGVDAVWFTPWYVSPLADGGYDVADYRAIDPAFGTLAEAELLIAEALDLGIRTIVDIVPNHVSDQHPWFVEALAGGPGHSLRDRFWFRPGRGPNRTEPPNNWRSQFGDIAWTRTTNPDGTAGDWYLHLFAPAQPDLNWDDPTVAAEHESIVRFWFDRGAAGIRIDSAALAVKDPALPDYDYESDSTEPHPYVDLDGVHDVYRSWRTIAAGYDPPRVLIGEVWLEDQERFAQYLRPDELHSAFNFDFMATPWDATALRSSIDRTLDSHAGVDAPPTWVLTNHDVTRVVTRYGRAESGFAFAAKRAGVPTDLELGNRRARAAALLVAALPGTLYVYQGDELGLPEVEDLTPDQIQDPMFFQSGGVDPGRDGCRVPMPWAGDRPPFAFSPDGTATWLPQPDGWNQLTAQRQSADAGSMLSLYRDVIALRREHLVNGVPLEWIDSGPNTLAFRRGAVTCVVNLGSAPISIPRGRLLLTSGPLDDGLLPTDTAVLLTATPGEVA